MRTVRADLMIIGSGGAGLFAAYGAVRAARKPGRILVVDKGLAGRSGATVCAQQTAGMGEWCAPGDSPELYFEDTIKAGKYLNNQKLVKIMLSEAAARIEDLERMGAHFKREGDGKYHLAEMAGHSRPRGLSYGDSTGKLIVDALRSELAGRGVEFVEDTLVTKLLVVEGKVAGAVGLDSRMGHITLICTGAVVLATGGAGQLYPLTTNPEQMTGDGLALALRAGADLTDLEFVQFYPVAAVYPEGMRGILLGVSQWSKLTNSEGERFMRRYDPVKMETATRDVLSQSIYREIRAGRTGPHGGVFLDARGLPDEIYGLVADECKLFLRNGVDLRCDVVEVAPAAHYMIGGVLVDERCATTVPGLFAAGEVTGGLHGANRLGNNSLLDTLVFGHRAGRFTVEYLDSAQREVMAVGTTAFRRHLQMAAQAEAERILAFLRPRRDNGTVAGSDGPQSPFYVRRKIQQIMWEKVGVIRDEQGLKSAIEQLASIEILLPSLRPRRNSLAMNQELVHLLETENLLLVASALVRCAKGRTESRGAHCREDYPATDDEHWLVNSLVRLRGDGLQVSWKPVELIESSEQ